MDPITIALILSAAITVGTSVYAQNESQKAQKEAKDSASEKERFRTQASIKQRQQESEALAGSMERANAAAIPQTSSGLDAGSANAIGSSGTF